MHLVGKTIMLAEGHSAVNRRCARRVQFHFLEACGATEVVPLIWTPGRLIAALEALRHPKSREGWGRGIPPFGFAQGRLLRKEREGWGTLGRWWGELRGNSCQGGETIQNWVIVMKGKGK